MILDESTKFLPSSSKSSLFVFSPILGPNFGTFRLRIKPLSEINTLILMFSGSWNQLTSIQFNIDSHNIRDYENTWSGEILITCL